MRTRSLLRIDDSISPRRRDSAKMRADLVLRRQSRRLFDRYHPEANRIADIMRLVGNDDATRRLVELRRPSLHLRFNLSWSRRVSLQCLMLARIVIIVQVIPQGSAQVSFADDDQMTETLSANRAYYAYGVWILEGRSRRGATSSICIPCIRMRAEIANGGRFLLVCGE
jgi:hypothetical protein